MPLRATESSLIPLNLAPSAAGLPAPRRIDCVPQRMSNWCWAACVEMIVANDERTVSQEDAVNWALGRSDCVGITPPLPCDCALAGVAQDGRPGIVDVLRHFGVTAEYRGSITDAKTLTQKLEQGPVMVVLRGESVGHVALIVSSLPAKGSTHPVLLLNDPRPIGGQQRSLGYLELRAGLDPLGPWRETIFITEGG
jgi:hypothetical protein